ncbi:MAG: TonB-dependent siderophore receptor [Thiotrichales bacterium]|nr:TonB-dependent siderophore receptor [Thiotrichales bacterium]
MKLSNLSLLITANLLAPITAYANDAQSENDLNNDQSNEIEHVIVTGKSIEEDVSLSLKTPELLINVPQSLSVVTAERIKEQGFRGIGDLLQYTPGVTVGQGEGQRDQITIRGQNTQADFFIDGLRDDAEYFRPFYNLERVEVLRGSNALIFGRGGAGGVINRVTKKPVYDEEFSDLSASINSFGSGFVTIDNNYAISENSGFRVNLFSESLANHRDFFDGNRSAVNPTFSTELGDDTSLLVSFEHVTDNRVVDRGVPSLNGRPLEGFTDTFFGGRDINLAEFEGNIFKTRIDHDISSQWSVDATVLYADYNKLYQNLFPSEAFDDVAGTIELDGYSDRRDRTNLLSQVNVVGEFDTGPLAHTLLFGFEYGDQGTTNTRADAFFTDSADDQITFAFSDPLVIPAVSFPELNRNRRSQVQVQSLFVQDQIDIGQYFKVIGGARYDRFDIDVNVRDLADLNNGTAGVRSRVDEEISPRIGLIFKPKENISLYASYSETFVPRSGGQFLTLSLTNEALAPEVFINSEIGFKWDINNALSLTTALFELERENLTTIDPLDAGNTIILAGSETRGIEIQLNGAITENWSVNVGYSNIDSEEVGRADGPNRTLAQTPEDQFSLWSRYDLNQKLGFGAGLIYQSGQFATISNAVELPSFTRVDAAVFYALGKNTDIQLNIENLLDEEYFPAAHSDNNISTGAPINARITISKRF